MSESARSQDADWLLRRLGLTGYAIESSIKVNGLWIRPVELQLHLARYAHRFVNNTGIREFQFQHFGTATGVKLNNRYFSVCTDHQRRLGTDHERGILTADLSAVITPKSMWTVKHTGKLDGDAIDFAVFEYEEFDTLDRSFHAQFIEVGEDYGVRENTGRITLNIGYPSSFQNVDYNNERVDLKVRSNFLEYVGLTSDAWVHEFRTIDEDSYFEDGMSGSPVFEVVRPDGYFSVRWLGIVVRGGANSRHGRVIDATFIADSIRQKML